MANVKKPNKAKVTKKEGKKVIKTVAVEEKKKVIEETVTPVEEKVQTEAEIPVQEENEENVPESTVTVEEAIKDFEETVKEKIEQKETENGEEESDLRGIEDIKKEVGELSSRKDILDKELEAHPEKAKEIIENEIKKVETLKNETEKLIKRLSNSSFTNSWNGQSYDF